MSQITFTGDVGRVAAATNADGSIIWYCYERPYLTGTSIFVQRCLNGVFQAEVRFLAAGQRPNIFFDPFTTQWIFTYVLNEKLYMITIGETDAPTPQPSQTGTLIDHYRLAPIQQPDLRSIAESSFQRDTGDGPIDADNSPPPPNALRVGASEVPGVNFTVQWRATPNTTSNQNLYCVGFNIYVRRYSDGALLKANSTMIPFMGFDPHVYTAEVPAVAGKYYVTQVNTKGPNSSQQIEGRIKPPFDEVFSNGVNLPTVNTSRMGQLFGQGRPGPEDLVFTVTSFAPVTIIPNDDLFKQTMAGDAAIPSSSYTFVYTVVQVVSASLYPPLQDTYMQSAFGEGLKLFISGSGTGVISIG